MKARTAIGLLGAIGLAGTWGLIIAAACFIAVVLLVAGVLFTSSDRPGQRLTALVQAARRVEPPAP